MRVNINDIFSTNIDAEILVFTDGKSVEIRVFEVNMVVVVVVVVVVIIICEVFHDIFMKKYSSFFLLCSKIKFN